MRRPGFYGGPWVSRIEADVERRSVPILDAFPDAGQIRKDFATSTFGWAAIPTRA